MPKKLRPILVNVRAEKVEATKIAIRKALLSRAFQNLIGAEEWDLTAEEEILLWEAIKQAKRKPTA